MRLPVLYNKKPCYDIVINRGFDEFVSEIQNLQITQKRFCIITDNNVSNLYAEDLEAILLKTNNTVNTCVIAAGENNKTLDTVKNIYGFLIENKFDRKDVLIALGGGVVGDITGYVAATYLRGVDYIQVPTTLLAQTDSSIGGKTGVDFDGYKNMVGAFKMPKLVYMNLSVLNTLEDRQYFSGFAEIMKHGLIKDANFYEWLIENLYEICDKDMDVIEEMLIRSCSIKKAVVEKDPKEMGERALLNFGHTIGHAIEKSMNFTLLHGECVALGSVAAAFISWKRELISMEEYYEIRDMFVPFNLPISISDIKPKEILELTKADKKMESGSIKFILLKKIGKAVMESSVTDKEILDAIQELIYIEE